jgi:hypothetical protein
MSGAIAKSSKTWIFHVVIEARSHAKGMDKDDASRFIAAFRERFGDDADAIMDDEALQDLGSAADEAVNEAWNALYGES